MIYASAKILLVALLSVQVLKSNTFSLQESNPFRSKSFSNIESSQKDFLSGIKKEHMVKKKLRESTRVQKAASLPAIKHFKMETIKLYRAPQLSFETQQKKFWAKKKKEKLLAKKRQKKKRSKTLTAKIDISQQRIRVYSGDKLLYKWKVSTGRKGYYTPRGKYKPKWITKMHYSKKYNNSPMPYSIFFKGGYAMHGTRSVKRLGRPASHGCVRLHTANAKRFYNLVRKHGKKNTNIVIVD